MSTHRIEIDDDVYTELERHVRGFERPNDVLRRLLLPAAGQASEPRVDARRRPGKLHALLEAGLINVGDTLKHHQPRKHRTFTATVEEGGWITTENGPYESPSPALAECVGSQIDGWAYWIHEPTGKSLRQLRGSAHR